MYSGQAKVRRATEALNCKGSRPGLLLALLDHKHLGFKAFEEGVDHRRNKTFQGRINTIYKIWYEM
jgi:hypothetical protein